jgi:phosphoglucomutase
MLGDGASPLRVEAAADFASHAPVDGGVSERQGVRVLFEGGSRVVYRLSGTGTEGATLRVYVEAYEPDPARQALDAQEALRPLVDVALALAEVRERTGRDRPTVIT